MVNQRFPALLVSLLFVFGLVPPTLGEGRGPVGIGVSSGESEGDLVFEDCELEGVEAEVDCGRLWVWEDRASAAGRLIPIYFVRARATGPDPDPDPLALLAGGPGEHASASADRRLRGRKKLLERRDILIMDQRGTGRSNPLECIHHDLETDPGAFAGLFDREFLDADAFRSCLETLRKTADPRFYTTSWIADDLDELRQALGYRQLHLAGGSYGTRLALEVLRRHEASVHSAVLRGVTPSTSLVVETLARDMEDAMEDVVRACAQDASCAAAYPDFGTHLTTVLDRIRRESVTLELKNPATGLLEPVVLRYEQLITAMRYALYSTELSARLPLQVEQAVGGDLAPLAGFLPEILSEIHNLVAEGMWASVKCSEELPFIDVERGRRLASGTMIGTLRMESELAICSFWPRGEIPRNFRDPVVSEVPVLLIAGELDPASPLRLARAAADHLENGILVEVKNRSHWGLGGPCIEEIIERFLEAPEEGDQLDVSCASRLKRPPFELEVDGPSQSLSQSHDQDTEKDLVELRARTEEESSRDTAAADLDE